MQKSPSSRIKGIGLMPSLSILVAKVRVISMRSRSQMATASLIEMVPDLSSSAWAHAACPRGKPTQSIVP